MTTCNQWNGSPSWIPIRGFAQKWLEICIKDHSHNQPAWFPTRLIDLGTPNDQYVKLIDTRSTPTRGPYATLSHRWADSAVITTTSSNLEKFLNTIPVAILSKTFQDAFIAARSYLGVRYIWIDSLCIIQDDPQDWRAESVTMQDVYSHSYCNLSAIATSSGVHGLFPPRDLDRARPCQVETNWEGRDPETYILIPKRFWDEQLDNAPLSGRGWVFQERWLAPRILHFSSDQLLWECCELNASEAYPRGIPEITCGTKSDIHHDLEVPADLQPHGNLTMLQKLLEWLGLQRNSKKDDFDKEVTSTGKRLIAQSNPLGLAPIIYGTQSSFKNRISAPAPLKPYENYKNWQRLVECYSTCKVTKEEDKLIAVSGIAKHFQSALGSEYLAGLWRENLPIELIWRVGSAESVSVQQLSTYRAPSWSWASVDTQIINKFVDCELLSLIAVTDSHIEHLWSDPFSPVTGGWIHVRGTLHPALLYPSDNYSWDLKYNLVLPQTGRQLYAMPDAEPKTSEFSRRPLRNPIIRRDRSQQMEEMLESFKSNGFFVPWYENPLYLLPVVSDALQRGTFGIVLEPVTSKRGTYKRWGWFEEAVPFYAESSFNIPYGDVRKKKKLYLDDTHQELKIV